MKSINIAVIGHTGVGKSSLINYIFSEKELAKTGSGKPVTKPGFHKFSKTISGKNYTIYDSYGLEKGKSKQWLLDFNKFIKPVQESKNIEEWLHCCIYCFSGASSRYQDFEINVLNKLIQEKLNPVVVITKADSKDAEKLAEKIFIQTHLKPVLVSSVNKKRFIGNVVAKGRFELMQKIINNSSESFLKRLKFILQSIEDEKIKKIYLHNFKHVKTYLKIEKNLLGNLPKKKTDYILNVYKREFEKDIKITKFELQEIKNNAIDYFKKQILFEELKHNSDINFNPDDFDDHKISVLEGLLLFTVGLPITITASLFLMFGPKTGAESVLKGLKNKIIKNTDKSELRIWLDENLDTSLED